MSEERKPYVHEVYNIKKCPKCGKKPILEHDRDITNIRRKPSRVRCVGCGLMTDWRMTRFQAEIAWDEGVFANSDAGD